METEESRFCFGGKKESNAKLCSFPGRGSAFVKVSGKPYFWSSCPLKAFAVLWVSSMTSEPESPQYGDTQEHTELRIQLS